jgi:hypothetical protein
MIKKLHFTIIGILILTNSLAQEIEIGQNAEEIRYIVERGSKYAPNTDWNLRYENGEISDVILCYYNEYIVDIGIEADFCKHFVMENGKLVYILTQYETLSIDQLKKYYNSLNQYRKVDDLYFSEDNKNYSKVYLHKNGLATVEWGLTDPKDMPKDKVNKKIDASLPISIQELDRMKKEFYPFNFNRTGEIKWLDEYYSEGYGELNIKFSSKWSEEGYQTGIFHFKGKFCSYIGKDNIAVVWSGNTENNIQYEGLITWTEEKPIEKGSSMVQVNFFNGENLEFYDMLILNM